MKKTVGCFTEDKLAELSEKPNTVVYKPTHDIVFEPWPANKVSEIVDHIISITLKVKTADEIDNVCMQDKLLKEFSEKYTKIYEKLREYEFVRDTENINVIKRLILLKAAVDKNMTTTEAAQAQVSDIALKSLSERIKKTDK